MDTLLQVRAAQLSDLVYKQGQAGISKATVTITFDNTDTSNRPVGFDKYDEIIVRRQVRFKKCSTRRLLVSVKTPIIMALELRILIAERLALTCRSLYNSIADFARRII